MTQLNLSGRPSNHPQQKSAAEPEGGSIKNQTVGALGALAMFAAVIVIGSCSRSSKPVAVAATHSTRGTRFRLPPLHPRLRFRRRAGRKQKPRSTGRPTLSYVNREYGLSFRLSREPIG